MAGLVGPLACPLGPVPLAARGLAAVLARAGPRGLGGRAHRALDLPHRRQVVTFHRRCSPGPSTLPRNPLVASRCASFNAIVIVSLWVASVRGADMADTHRGYVAGRYRDGALSDTWTDVTRCAEQTFIAYVARCGCGWLGDDQPANPDGYHTSQHQLINNHLF